MLRLSLLFLLFFPLKLTQAKDSPSPLPGQVTAQRVPNHSLHIDGYLDEAAWQNTQFISDFRQADPNEGEPSRLETRVGFLYDDQALYIGARMFCNDPNQIIALVSRRDAVLNSERIIISLDTYLDRRTAYSFGVTATGVRVDYYHPTDSEFRRDYSFDPVWEAKTHIDSTGWTAEIRIPFSQLRFNGKPVQEWGLNINRWIPFYNEDAYWIYVPKNETGWSSRFGRLIGIRGVKPSRRLELLPYSATEATIDNTSDPNSPFYDQHRLDLRGGLDLKIGLGPNLTLDGAINPDFGQVEADPAEVNLTAFETFFDERRPFFTEGAQLLRGSGPGYFYSRRIGAAPHGSASGDYVDQPQNTTILGAAKVTGRLNSGLSIGVLTAVTDKEYASTASDSLPTPGREQVEPLTGYGVVRLQKEFGQDASTAGLIFTGVRRDVTPGEELAKTLNRQAYSGGGDWNLRFQGGDYELSGYLGFSYIEGDSNAIASVQNSSAHYFQRPDADYVRLDSSRTSLAGYTASAQLRKNSGKHWLWRFGASAESPNFELNDLGRLRSADELEVFGRLIYRENQPSSHYHSYSINATTSVEWNYGGVRQRLRSRLEGQVVFKNFWRMRSEFGYSLHSLSDKLTRGGPLMRTANSWWVEWSLGNNFASQLLWNIRTDYFQDELGAWGFRVSPWASFRLANRWEFIVNPFFERNVETRQYVSTISRGREETFHNRYIFSTVDRKTLSARLRLNFAFTPDLTLELYAEPFAASGRFYNFGELTRPRTDRLSYYDHEGRSIVKLDESEYQVQDGQNTFSFERPDFLIHSFRSNMVLRWEWLPGSTLFLVWQQNRFNEDNSGAVINGWSLWDTVHKEGDHFFALKLSYWLPVN